MLWDILVQICKNFELYLLDQLDFFWKNTAIQEIGWFRLSVPLLNEGKKASWVFRPYIFGCRINFHFLLRKFLSTCLKLSIIFKLDKYCLLVWAKLSILNRKNFLSESLSRLVKSESGFEQTRNPRKNLGNHVFQFQKN